MIKVELRLYLPLHILAEGDYSKDCEELEVNFSEQDIITQVNLFIEHLKNASTMQGEILEYGNSGI